MLKNANHPDVSVLSDYASGRLNNHQSDLIDAHLADCDSCCDRLDEIGNGHIDELLRSVKAEHLLVKESSDDSSDVSSVTTVDVLHGEARYEFRSEIGSGGMGVVYEAWDRQLRRSVAVKTLQTSGNSQQLAERFVREAMITACLSHPGVPSTHELGRLEDGRPFMALRLVKGQTLTALLTEHRISQMTGHSEPSGLLAIFGRLCDCVAYAHANEILHRDIKPSNVMVGEFGEVQLMDWGLAKRLTQTRAGAAEPASETELQQDNRPASADFTLHETHDTSSAATTDVHETQAGTVMGTISYMSPEQALGDRKSIGPCNDVFSLGAVLCEILTGRPPHDADSKEQRAIAARRGDLSALQDRLKKLTLDHTLVELMLRCLASDPSHRPADAREVATEFSAWQATVAKRLEQARLAQVRSETEVKEERKRRHVQIALLLGTVAFAATVWRLNDNNQRQEAAFAAKERQREWTLKATARADLASFDVALNKAVGTLNESEPLWKEAEFYLARAADAGDTLRDPELSTAVDSAREQQKLALKRAEADRVVLDGMRQMAMNSRVGRPSGGAPGELVFVDGIGPSGDKRTLAGGPSTRGSGGQSAGRGRGRLLPQGPETFQRLAFDKAHRAVEAFQAYGLDPTLMSASDVADSIRERPVAFQAAIRPQIEIWFHYAVSGNHTHKSWVATLINDLDGDEFRTKLRLAMLNNDLGVVLTTATAPSFPQQPGELVWSVASLLHRTAPGVSSELLALAHLNHLDSSIIMWDLSRTMSRSGRATESLRILLMRAALEENPALRARALVHVGTLFARRGEPRKVIMVIRQAMELSPGSFPQEQFVRDLQNSDDVEFKIFTLREMLTHGTLTSPDAWLALGDLSFDSQRWEQARAAFRTAYEGTQEPELQAMLDERIAMCDLMLGESLPAN